MVKNSTPFDYSSNKPTIDLSVMPSDSISLSELNNSTNFSTNLFEMKKGDILFGSIRPYLHKGGFAPCDGVVAGTVHSFSPINMDDYNFILFTLMRKQFFDYAVNASSGTKMPVISADSIMNYKIAYNPQVAKAFNDIDIVDTISNNIMEIIELKHIRDFLLPMLMNGQAQIQD